MGVVVAGPHPKWAWLCLEPSLLLFFEIPLSRDLINYNPTLLLASQAGSLIKRPSYDTCQLVRRNMNRKVYIKFKYLLVL